MTPAVRRLVPVLALLATAGGCATYRFGNATLYAPNVRTVYVPVFQCDSFRTTPAIDIGERHTASVSRSPMSMAGVVRKLSHWKTGT